MNWGLNHPNPTDNSITELTMVLNGVASNRPGSGGEGSQPPRPFSSNYEKGRSMHAVVLEKHLLFTFNYVYRHCCCGTRWCSCMFFAL